MSPKYLALATDRPKDKVKYRNSFVVKNAIPRIKNYNLKVARGKDNLVV